MMLEICQEYFREVGIDFYKSNDYDYLFIGMNDFMNKNGHWNKV